MAAATLIIDFSLYDLFDPIQIILDLCANKLDGQIKRFLQGIPQMVEVAIEVLSTPLNGKIAANLIDAFKLDIKDYPKVYKIVCHNACNYYISRSFRAPNHPDHLPFYKVEDLIDNNPIMLVCMVQALLKKKLVHQAVGIYKRHKLGPHLSPEQKAELDSIKYEKNKDFQHKDFFGPVAQDKPCMRLLPDILVEFIGKE